MKITAVDKNSPNPQDIVEIDVVDGELVIGHRARQHLAIRIDYTPELREKLKSLLDSTVPTVRWDRLRQRFMGG